MRWRTVIGWAVVGTLFCAIAMWAAPAGSGSSDRLALAVSSESSSASIPPLIRFSAAAADFSSSTQNITFSLYGSAQSTTPLWSETQQVQIDNQGDYTVMLGSTRSEGLPLELFTNGSALWLGVQIADQAEQPRTLMVAVPYAFKAADAETLGGLPPSAFMLAPPAGAPAVRGARPSGAQAASVTSSAPAAAKPAGNAVPAAATPCGSTFTSDGTGTANKLVKFKAPCNTTTSAVFESAGKVGIGTTTPAVTLDVAGAVRGTELVSTVGTGVAPLSVASTTQVPNLNASLLEGMPASKFATLGPNTFTGDQTVTGSGLGAAVEVFNNGTAILANGTKVGLFGQGATTAVVSGTGGVGVQATGGNDTNGSGGAGVIASGGNSGVFGGLGIKATGGSANLTDGSGAPGVQGIGGNGFFAGPGAFLDGGSAASFTGGTGGAGVSAAGGPADLVSGTGGNGVFGQGGNAFRAGYGAKVVAGSAAAAGGGFGGVGILALGGAADTTKGNGGAGVSCTGGDARVAGSAVIATGGSAAGSTDGKGGAGVSASGGPGGSTAGPGGDGIDGSGGPGPVQGGRGASFSGGNATSTTKLGNGGTGISAVGGSTNPTNGGAGGDGIFAKGGVGKTNGLAGNFSGDVTVSGTVTAANLNVLGSKNFKIENPADPTKYLFHASVESSEMKNIYDGVTVMDRKGQAVVTLPRWFQALNGDFRYQLTCMGGWAPVYIKREIDRNQFTIAGGNPGMKVSWQVTGVRHDAAARAHPLVVEMAKSDDPFYRREVARVRFKSAAKRRAAAAIRPSVARPTT